MKKKILIFAIIGLFIGANSIPCVNAIIKIGLSEKIDTFPEIHSVSLTSRGDAYTKNQATFGYEYFRTEWDSDRNMWCYKYRFNWYTICPEEYEYYQLGVTTRTVATDVVSGSSNEFGYGGYNISEGSGGDFSNIGEYVCSLVIGMIPYAGYFKSGAALATALRNHIDPEHPEDTTETHVWLGGKVWGEDKKWIKEASGFYQYDVYVNPSTDFEVNWNIDVDYCCKDKDQDPDDEPHLPITEEFTMGWSLETTSPDYLSFDQTSIDFEEVKVGECSSEKSLTLINAAENDVTVYGFTLSETAFEITEGDDDRFTISGNGGSKTIKIKFCPKGDADYKGTIKPELFQDIEPECKLLGTGKQKSRCMMIPIRISNILDLVFMLNPMILKRVYIYKADSK
jgi:hypothetical protein